MPGCGQTPRTSDATSLCGSPPLWVTAKKCRQRLLLPPVRVGRPLRLPGKRWPESRECAAGTRTLSHPAPRLNPRMEPHH